MKRSVFIASLFLVALGGCHKTALRFSPDRLPDAKVGEAYRAEVTVLEANTPVGGMNVAQGGALPPGLELRYERDGHGGKKNTGVIEGTPTKAGEYAFNVVVWCYGTNVSGQQGAHDYRIVVR